MPRITPAQAGSENRCAFLDMLAASEIGSPLLSESDDGYNVLVGSTPSRPLLFHSYAAHPDVFNAALNSDAAGRYQIMHYWWLRYLPILHLPDFSPVSQDLYALRILHEHGAIPLIDAGRFAEAVAACKTEWASLPGSGDGQHENDLAELQAAYQRAGGIVVA